MRTTTQTYARTRSDGVLSLAMIDRRLARHVSIETTAVIQQANGPPSKFSRNVRPRILRPRLAYASMSVQVVPNNVLKTCWAGDECW